MRLLLALAVCAAIGLAVALGLDWRVSKPPPQESERPVVPRHATDERAQVTQAPPPGVAIAALPLQAGRSWRYEVIVEPPRWRDITLTYNTVQQGETLGVNTEFRYAGGQTNFHLGTFAAGHASHAYTLFPGFFMYAAYLDRPLEVGQRFIWEWPWLLPDRQVREGRVKRYVAEVKQWELLPAPPSVNAPMNLFNTARIDVTLFYLEDGRVRAAAAETLWYAPRFMQVVRVQREGSTPEEGLDRIVAELVELR